MNSSEHFSSESRLDLLMFAKNIFDNWMQKRNLDYSKIEYQHFYEIIPACKKEKNYVPKTYYQLQHGLKQMAIYLIENNLIGEELKAELFAKGLRHIPIWEYIPYSVLEGFYAQHPQRGALILKNKVTLGFVIYQNLTYADITALKVSHVDFENSTVYVPARRPAFAARVLNLNENQKEALELYLAAGRDILLELAEMKSDLLFPSPTRSNRTTSNTTTKLLRKFRKFYSAETSREHISASIVKHWIERYGMEEAKRMSGCKFLSGQY